MKSSRIAALIAAASLALVMGLAACGSSEDSSSSEGSSDTSSASTTAEKAAPDSSKGGGGALTPPGTQLKPGEAATLAWVPFSEDDDSGPEKGIDLEVSVESIEKGSIDDFQNVELEPGVEKSTPYYVKIRVEAVTGTEPPPDEEPYIAFDAIDGNDEEHTPVIFTGVFDRCDSVNMPRPFTNGKSYESCLTYLIPDGGSIERVQWDDGPSEGEDLTPYVDDPVVWEGS